MSLTAHLKSPKLQQSIKLLFGANKTHRNRKLPQSSYHQAYFYLRITVKIVTNNKLQQS